MKKVLLFGLCMGLASPVALAGDPYETWLNLQNQRGMEIEMIRVASEKPLQVVAETDAEVADILEAIEAIEAVEAAQAVADADLESVTVPDRVD